MIVSVKKDNLKKMGYNNLEEWIQNDNNVYIGRKVVYVKGTFNSIFRNPYSVKKYGRVECINMYKQYILNNTILMTELKKLKGKTLGCWCKPAMCHGDVLLDILNNMD